VEVANTQGTELGLPGLQQMICQNLQLLHRLDLTRLEQQLLEYTGSLRLPDDLTLVCVHWRPDSNPKQPSQSFHDSNPISHCGNGHRGLPQTGGPGQL
jgi:hypothetical protein